MEINPDGNFSNTLSAYLLLKVSKDGRWLELLERKASMTVEIFRKQQCLRGQSWRRQSCKPTHLHAKFLSWYQWRDARS